jgi:prephenate dehydrogenase
MAGSERRGAAAADPLLFQDAVYALCPVGDVPEDHVNKLSLALKSIGSNPILLDPARHDRLAAAISHVPYLLSAALSNSAGRMDDELTLRFAAGGFRDMTRIASSPYSVWKDVLATNRGPIRERLAAVRQALDTIEASLDIEEKLKPELEDAARYRLNIPRNLQGLQRPENEIIVRIMDEPGALSSVTTSLAREKINICDIQVLKVRHDEDGVLRLAFVDRPTTLRAVEVLRQAGHYVRLRGE